MGAKITSLNVFDVHFPTSTMLDGSDAMNADPDYSAGYLRIDTDQAGLSGHSLVFTIGRGNDVQIAAIKMLVERFAGMDIDDAFKNIGKITRELSSDSQIRWLGPDTGVFHMGIGAVLNALWDLFAKARNVPLWKLLADMSPEEIVAAIDFRYISDAITPSEALAILKRAKAQKLRMKRFCVLKDYLPIQLLLAGLDIAMRKCSTLQSKQWLMVLLSSNINAENLRKMTAAA